jgi:flagellar biosynthesis/type III secretory pathway ATPase
MGFKKNERLNNISFLKYPPIDIVKSINKYNRANTPNTTVLYTTENIDSALKEIKPPINKLITVGLWKPKEQKNLFLIQFLIAIEQCMSIQECRRQLQHSKVWR